MNSPVRRTADRTGGELTAVLRRGPGIIERIVHTPSGPCIEVLALADDGREELAAEQEILQRLAAEGVRAAPRVLGTVEGGYRRELLLPLRLHHGRRAAALDTPATQERIGRARAREDLEAFLAALHAAGWVLGSSATSPVGVREDGTAAVIDLRALSEDSALAPRLQDRHWLDLALEDGDRTLPRSAWDMLGLEISPRADAQHSTTGPRDADDALAQWAQDLPDAPYEQTEETGDSAYEQTGEPGPGAPQRNEEAARGVPEQTEEPVRRANDQTAPRPDPHLITAADVRSLVRADRAAALRETAGPRRLRRRTRAGTWRESLTLLLPRDRVALVLALGLLLGVLGWAVQPLLHGHRSVPAVSAVEPVASADRQEPTASPEDPAPFLLGEAQKTARDLIARRHRFITGAHADPVAVPGSLAQQEDDAVRDAYVDATVEGGEPEVLAASWVSADPAQGRAVLEVRLRTPAHTVRGDDGRVEDVPASGEKTVRLDLEQHGDGWAVRSATPVD